LCVKDEKEEEEEKEVVLTKMHKSLRKLINKSPDKYDDDNEIDDLTESFEKTFREEEENGKVYILLTVHFSIVYILLLVHFSNINLNEKKNDNKIHNLL